MAPENRAPSAKTQLARAAKDGNVDEVRALLLAGGSPDLALWIAAMNGRAEVVALALQFGAPLTGLGDPGVLALSTALGFSNKRTQERLKVKGGDGYDEIIAMLLDRGVPAESTNMADIPLLMSAALAGNAKAVSLLLDHGAQPDRQFNNGGTALGGAAFAGHGEVVEILVKAGASVDLAGEKGATPLLSASWAGSNEALDLITGRSSKDLAWTKGYQGGDYLRAVKALLKANAEVNTSSETGATPLMAACRAGDLGIAEALLDAGAGLHYADQLGRTPLMFAVLSGKVPLAELILKLGADPKAVALDGDTAVSIARRGKSPEMVRVLKLAFERKSPQETTNPLPRNNPPEHR